MRKYCLPTLFIAAIFLLGRFSSLPDCAHASGGFAGNGDINGDGKIDISDAVALLGYLFQGGGPPVACADGTGLTAEQAEILSHLSLVALPDGHGGSFPTIRVSGVNVQVVNGRGNTESINGVGNLIVGYQETRSLSNDRTGSHNLVVGSLHNYTAFGGVVAGVGNSVTGLYGSVLGGTANVASGVTSTVCGGQLNVASGSGSFVGGGGGNALDGGNEAFADYSTVLGGIHNLAGDASRTSHEAGSWSSITGGVNNIASGQSSSVTGGDSNTASGEASTVSGGKGHTASGDLDWAGGGLLQDE